MIYLKAPNQEFFEQALIDAGWTYEQEQPDEVTVVVQDCYTATHSLDIIGTIYKETGNTITVEATDDMPEHEYPETAPVDGYHANLLLHGEELPEALSDFVIDTPTNPQRKFA